MKNAFCSSSVHDVVVVNEQESLSGFVGVGSAERGIANGILIDIMTQMTMDPVGSESARTSRRRMPARFRHDVQFHVAGNVPFFGDSAQSTREFNSVLRSNAFVSIANDNPHGALGEFLRLIRQTHFFDQQMLLPAAKLAQRSQIRDWREPCSALHATVVRSKVNRQESTA